MGCAHVHMSTHPEDVVCGMRPSGLHVVHLTLQRGTKDLVSGMRPPETTSRPSGTI